jgi:hypothetical protein
MTAREIKCEVYGFGDKDRYADGLERIELYVSEPFVEFVERIPKEGERLQITFSTPTGIYDGGIRNYQGRSPYICPNLVSQKDGKKVSLARVLKDNGVKPRDSVTIRVSDSTWTLLASR